MGNTAAMDAHPCLEDEPDKPHKKYLQSIEQVAATEGGDL